MNQQQSEFGVRKVAKWLAFILLGVAIYFGNKQVQSHFGQQALAEIEFDILDLDVALAKAQAHEKLVIADMSAIWCPTCRKLDQTVFVDSKVRSVIEENFVFARVEYESEQGKNFMQTYGVSGFPVLLVLDASGQKLTRLPLTFEPGEFIGHLNSIIEVGQN